MKKWLIAATVLLVLGAVICFAACAAMGFDLKKTDTGKYETNTYTIKDHFHSIFVDGTTEDIVFEHADDGACRVICLEEEKQKHAVSVENGTLTIRAADERGLLDRVGINTQSMKITLCLPESAYADLKIDMDTGDVLLSGFGFDSVDVRTTTGDISASDVSCKGDVQLRVDTGKIHLKDLTCTNLLSEGTTGDVTLEKVTASDAISLKRDTGDVVFLESDADTITVKTSTGNVTGSLLTDKVFITDTHTGKVEVPAGTSGGKCEITTDTGNIKIEIKK